MVNLTSEFVRHMPCSNCGSSDGNSLYSDGHTYCFVCHDRTGGNDVIHSQNVSKTVQLTGSAERLHKRKISEKTIADLLEQLGVSYLYESEKLSYTIEHHYTQGLRLNLVSIRSLISLEMELPMVVLSSWLVYKLSQ